MLSSPLQSMSGHHTRRRSLAGTPAGIDVHTSEH